MSTTNALHTYSPASTEHALHIKQILVATDFSPCSKTALEKTANLAREYGATLTLLHIVTRFPRPGNPLASQFVGHMAPIPAVINARHFATKEMAKLRQSPCLRGLRVETIVWEGHPANIICNLARESAIDLIVVGTAGRKGAKRVALGSVAEQIIRRSPCPVMIAGPRSKERPVERAVVCAIRRPACSDEIRFAWKLSADRQAKLVFVHVVESASATAYSFDKAMTEAVMREAIMQAVSPAPMPKCELVIEYDHGYEGILHCAKVYRAAFLVMGAQRINTFVETATHLGHGTLADVIAGASCPVFAIPDEKKQRSDCDEFADLAEEIC